MLLFSPLLNRQTGYSFSFKTSSRLFWRPYSTFLYVARTVNVPVVKETFSSYAPQPPSPLSSPDAPATDVYIGGSERALWACAALLPSWQTRTQVPSHLQGLARLDRLEQM